MVRTRRIVMFNRVSAEGFFATPDGKARFSLGRPLAEEKTASDPLPHGDVFRLSTRRGKQFNSMVQREIDPLTGADRDAVLISPEDLARLGLREQQPVRLRSADGVYAARLHTSRIKPGNLEVHWPEGNVLLSGSAIDPDSMEPDYNAVVTLEAI